MRNRRELPPNLSFLHFSQIPNFIVLRYEILLKISFLTTYFCDFAAIVGVFLDN